MAVQAPVEASTAPNQGDPAPWVEPGGECHTQSLGTPDPAWFHCAHAMPRAFAWRVVVVGVGVVLGTVLEVAGECVTLPDMQLPGFAQKSERRVVLNVGFSQQHG
jgi:hypothetical protein